MRVDGVPLGLGAPRADTSDITHGPAVLHLFRKNRPAQPTTSGEVEDSAVRLASKSQVLAQGLAHRRCLFTWLTR